MLDLCKCKNILCKQKYSWIKSTNTFSLHFNASHTFVVHTLLPSRDHHINELMKRIHDANTQFTKRLNKHVMYIHTCYEYAMNMYTVFKELQYSKNSKNYN